MAYYKAMRSVGNDQSMSVANMTPRIYGDIINAHPPLNRPSVKHATSRPSPAPMIRLVGLSISGIPGPPFGPRYLKTTTVFSPFLIDLVSIACTNSASLSNTRAFPLKDRPSLPVILETAPPGARLPRNMLIANIEKWCMCK
ncbi:hypothetical protein AG1IA_07015 [Rhizoctonia solani AG-1 IA]|uniref:Uncharacterized protein n=1 Tax=Thanatephorus cucumeris (strain AG1-IA) TaxID=983506 RepID=L8WQ99_THACA|nr:hypothetical protein AG1IA_07015 [Rhizoctonia solani AG-1 IA]